MQSLMLRRDGVFFPFILSLIIDALVVKSIVIVQENTLRQIGRAHV